MPGHVPAKRGAKGMNINWATWITGGIGLVLSVFFYLRGKKEKAPRYTLEDNNLFEKLPDLVPELKVEYKGEQISNLTITKVRFWNAGKDTINDTDVVQPIVIEAQSECKIISAKLVRANQEANEFKCSLPEQGGLRVTISFRYLDFNEGGQVQIAHTGTGKERLKLTGRVKQAGTPKQVIYSKKTPQSVPPPRWLRLTIGIVAIIIPLILMGPMLIAFLLEPGASKAENLVTVLLTGLVIAILSVIFWLLGYVILFLQLPEGLE
jgi:hypothetical protein